MKEPCRSPPAHRTDCVRTEKMGICEPRRAPKKPTPPRSQISGLQTVRKPIPAVSLNNNRKPSWGSGAERGRAGRAQHTSLQAPWPALVAEQTAGTPGTREHYSGATSNQGDLLGQADRSTRAGRRDQKRRAQTLSEQEQNVSNGLLCVHH